MKTSNKLAWGMTIVGALGMTASFAGCYSGCRKAVYMAEESPPGQRMAQINAEISQLEKQLVDCVPTKYNTVVSDECVDKRNKLPGLQQEYAALKNDPVYISLREDGRSLFIKTLIGYSIGFLASSLLYNVGVSGVFSRNRKRLLEEIKKEKNPEEHTQ